MANTKFGNGINIAAGFDLSAEKPLDARYTVATLDERNAHITNYRAYEGMLVYVEADQKTYQYVNNEWKEFGFNQSDFQAQVVDNLDSTEKDKALSANMGRELNEKIVKANYEEDNPENWGYIENRPFYSKNFTYTNKIDNIENYQDKILANGRLEIGSVDNNFISAEECLRFLKGNLREVYYLDDYDYKIKAGRIIDIELDQETENYYSYFIKHSHEHVGGYVSFFLRYNLSSSKFDTTSSVTIEEENYFRIYGLTMYYNTFPVTRQFLPNAYINLDTELKENSLNPITSKAVSDAIKELNLGGNLTQYYTKEEIDKKLVNADYEEDKQESLKYIENKPFYSIKRKDSTNVVPSMFSVQPDKTKIKEVLTENGMYQMARNPEYNFSFEEFVEWFYTNTLEYLQHSIKYLYVFNPNTYNIDALNNQQFNIQRSNRQNAIRLTDLNGNSLGEFWLTNSLDSYAQGSVYVDDKYYLIIQGIEFDDSREFIKPLDNKYLTIDVKVQEQSTNTVSSGAVAQAIQEAKEEINIKNYYNREEVDNLLPQQKDLMPLTFEDFEKFYAPQEQEKLNIITDTELLEYDYITKEETNEILDSYYDKEEVYNKEETNEILDNYYDKEEINAIDEKIVKADYEENDSENWGYIENRPFYSAPLIKDTEYNENFDSEIGGFFGTIGYATELFWQIAKKSNNISQFIIDNIKEITLNNGQETKTYQNNELAYQPQKIDEAYWIKLADGETADFENSSFGTLIFSPLVNETEPEKSYPIVTFAPNIYQIKFNSMVAKQLDTKYLPIDKQPHQNSNNLIESGAVFNIQKQIVNANYDEENQQSLAYIQNRPFYNVQIKEINCTEINKNKTSYGDYYTFVNSQLEGISEVKPLIKVAHVDLTNYQEYLNNLRGVVTGDIEYEISDEDVIQSISYYDASTQTIKTDSNYQSYYWPSSAVYICNYANSAVLYDTDTIIDEASGTVYNVEYYIVAPDSGIYIPCDENNSDPIYDKLTLFNEISYTKKIDLKFIDYDTEPIRGSNKLITSGGAWKLRAEFAETQQSDWNADPEEPNAIANKPFEEVLQEVQSGRTTDVVSSDGIYQAIENAKTYILNTLFGGKVPEKLDTLMEIADWIASDESGTADLINRVTTLEGYKLDAIVYNEGKKSLDKQISDLQTQIDNISMVYAGVANPTTLPNTIGEDGDLYIQLDG